MRGVQWLHVRRCSYSAAMFDKWVSWPPQTFFAEVPSVSLLLCSCSCAPTAVLQLRSVLGGLRSCRVNSNNVCRWWWHLEGKEGGVVRFRGNCKLHLRTENAGSFGNFVSTNLTCGTRSVQFSLCLPYKQSWTSSTIVDGMWCGGIADSVEEKEV